MKFDRMTFFEWFKHDRSNKWLLLAFSTLLIGVFILFTAAVREADAGHIETVGQLDLFISQWMTHHRNAALNTFFLFLTDLGSFNFLTMAVLIFAVCFIYLKRWVFAIQLISGSVGSALITYLLKAYFARSRPNVLQMLTTAQGYSYPSGHSLSSAGIYLTMAILLNQIFTRKVSKMIVFLVAALLAVGIAISRVYLGVHYFSDITAGLLVGTATASLNGAYFSHIKIRE